MSLSVGSKLDLNFGRETTIGHPFRVHRYVAGSETDASIDRFRASMVSNRPFQRGLGRRDIFLEDGGLAAKGNPLSTPNVEMELQWAR